MLEEDKLPLMADLNNKGATRGNAMVKTAKMSEVSSYQRIRKEQSLHSETIEVRGWLG